MVSVPHHRRAAALEIAERLTSAGSIAVCTHVNGDGDGWGCACALAYHFRPAGAEVHLLAASPYPDRYAFILPPGPAPLGPDDAGLEALRSADVQLVVDASEPTRLAAFAPLFDPARTIVIDHHAVAAGSIEASCALIDAGAAATAELIYDVLTCSGAGMSPGTATALYVGLVTDTGSFRYSNSTPHAHRLAAALLEIGVDPEALYRPLFAHVSSVELGTLQVALARHQHDGDYGITWSTLDPGSVQEFGLLEEYEGIIDHLRNLRGTEIAILFRDLGDGSVKISLRSTGRADVAAVAGAYGGGGHRKAAGAVIEGELESVVVRVLESCRVALDEGAS